MKKFLIGVALATLISTAAVAGPCDVAGAIPDCEAILSGKTAQKFEETSKLDYGASDPQTVHARPIDPTKATADEIADRMDRIIAANDALDLKRAEYALRVARRHLSAVIEGIK
jgi:hypothetical protein